VDAQGPGMKLLLKWLLSATALIALSELHPGIEVASFAVALSAALVIGLLNLLLRPLLVLLTLPVTVLSLGLFVFVINAFLFWMAAEMLDNFRVDSFGDALVGSLFYSALGMLIDSALKQLLPPK
jgi:putative membrane protein